MKYYIIVAILFLVFGCDLFTTRPPEEPKTTGNSLIPATTPDILFDNFKKSFEDKFPENYSSVFVNSSFLDKKYRFIPVTSTSTQFPVLNNWGIEEENQFFKSLKGRANPGASVSLLFSNQSNNQLGDSALYQFDYLVSVSAQDNTINGEYKGSAQFKIFLDTRGQWVIVNWEDIQTGNNRNWSELKGRLY
ncbi:MAG: hypothetical protein KF816_07905 [Melioribacteraceae bacterium]|nr:hypothetical protein [Melioribacteraceae bacterium]